MSVAAYTYVYRILCASHDGTSARTHTYTLRPVRSLYTCIPSVVDCSTLSWSDLRAWNAGVSDSAKFSVRDVWTAGEKGAFSGSYTATNVPSHGVAMLILTPSM